MSNRLQAGGLALIINETERENIGKVVQIIGKQREGVRGAYCMTLLSDHWEVYSEHGLMFPDGLSKDTGLIHKNNLIPLDDKQTQDKLAKEKELENV